MDTIYHNMTFQNMGEASSEVMWYNVVPTDSLLTSDHAMHMFLLVSLLTTQVSISMHVQLTFTASSLLAHVRKGKYSSTKVCLVK